MLCWQIVRGEQKEGNKRWDLQLHNVLWLRNVKYKCCLLLFRPVGLILGTTCRTGMQYPDNRDEYEDDDDDNEYDQWDCFLKTTCDTLISFSIMMMTMNTRMMDDQWDCFLELPAAPACNRKTLLEGVFRIINGYQKLENFLKHTCTLHTL